MIAEAERTLLDHVESSAFAEIVKALAEEQRVSKALGGLNDRGLGITACLVEDLRLEDIDVDEEAGYAVVHGRFSESLRRTDDSGRIVQAVRRGVISGYVRVCASFPRPRNRSDREGYLSDISIDLGELAWLPYPEAVKLTRNPKVSQAVR